MAFKLPNLNQALVMTDGYTKSFRRARRQMVAFYTPVERLRKRLKVLSNELMLDKLKNNFSKLRTSFSKVGDGLKKTIARFSAVSAGASGGLFLLAKNAANMGDEIAKSAMRLGLSTDALQEFRFAADRSGISASTFDMAMQRFGRRAAEAAAGTGEAKDALGALGIKLTDSNGKMRDVEELFNDVADAMAKIESPIERNRAAMKLFDSEGVKLVQMMGQGSKGIKEMRLEAQKLGGVLSEDAAKGSEAFIDAQTNLMFAFKGLRMELGGRLMPIMKEFMEQITKALKQNQPQIQAFIDKFSEALPKAIDKVVSAFKLLWAIIRPFIKITMKFIELIGIENAVLAGLAAFISGPFVLAMVAAIPAVLMFSKSLFDTFMIIRKVQKITKAGGGLKKFSLSFKGFGRIIKGFFTPLKAVGRFLAGPLLTGLRIAGMAVLKFGATLMTTPVGWILAAIAAIAVAAWLIYDNWEAVKGFILDMWEEISGFMDTRLGKILLIMTPFLSIPLLIIKHWEPISKFFKNLWNVISNEFVNAINLMQKTWDKFRGSSVGKWLLDRPEPQEVNLNQKNETLLQPGGLAQAAGVLPPGQAQATTQNARVEVSFKNMPPGARVSEPIGDADTTINQGFAFGGI